MKRGETIALVGPTGGGKSTHRQSALPLLRADARARILIGGRDYTDMTLHGIQSRIGMVLQTPHLFCGTIRENIRYGRLDATDDEVEAAAKLAGAHEFIIDARARATTRKWARAATCSRSARSSCISLARAVLADPEIFIMDEATSSVDTLTEALIQQGMETLMDGRTSFVIAHRLSTIRRADRILVIENGGIAEMGTHAELAAPEGALLRAVHPAVPPRGRATV